jgi:hypothetical protein
MKILMELFLSAASNACCTPNNAVAMLSYNKNRFYRLRSHNTDKEMRTLTKKKKTNKNKTKNKTKTKTKQNKTKINKQINKQTKKTSYISIFEQEANTHILRVLAN